MGRIKRTTSSSRSVNPTLNTPSGTILPFGGDTAPEGYLLCDGSQVDREKYSGLWATIGQIWGQGDGTLTFNLPDLRGYAIRGTDDMGTSKGAAGRDPDSASRGLSNAGGNSGNNVGSTQQDGFASHNHGGGNHGHGTHWDVASKLGTDGPFDYSSSAAHIFDMDYRGNPIQNSGAIIALNGGNETRMKNVYVNFIIKI